MFVDGVLPEPNSTKTNIEAERILVIDDDADYGRFLRVFLTKNRYDVRHVMSGQEGLQEYHRFHPSLIILDVIMPGMNGLDFCRYFRKTSSVPVIFLSAVEEEPTILNGYDCGAVDYIVKPFSSRLFLARVKLALRIGSLIAATTRTSSYSDGYLDIDLSARRIMIDDEPVQLTTTEFAVLHYLLQHANAPCSVGQILQHVWGDSYLDATGHVYTYIRRLRQKLERGDRPPEYIVSVHGRGYQFNPRRSMA